MSKFCLNPTCKNPQNPNQNKICHGCNANLAKTTQSYIFENYRITKLLGEGGFGRTYLAEYLRRYNEPRLIKTLITSGHKQTQHKIKELFTREAEQLYHLDHPQIPKLYEYFEKDNNLYLVQEFIDGINLREELKQEGPFSEEKIQTLLEKLLPVLTYIEDKNLLHRDIKPDNIMRRHSDGVLMLIDFGAARVKTGMGLTLLTAIYTPGYAAIEHMMGRPVKASDIYSLGVTCIRLLTGCLPSHTTDPIYDDHENCLCWKEYLQENNIQVSDRLIAILDKMVASSLRDRYPDAKAVLKDLLRPISPPVSLPKVVENKQQSPEKVQDSGENSQQPLEKVQVFGENSQNFSVSPSFSVAPQTSPKVVEKRQNYTVHPSFSAPSQQSGKFPKKLGLLAGAVAILTGVLGIGGYFLINQSETIDNNTQESIDKNDTIPILETLESQYQQGNYQDCYKLATDNYVHERDVLQKYVLQEWIGKCGLEAAKIKANADSYSDAIAIAQTIPTIVPNYQEVEDSINIWSGKILEYATQVYQQGKLEDAIKVTDTIPDNSSAKTKIPDLISQWEQEQKQKQQKQEQEQEKQRQEQQEQIRRQVSLISQKTGLDYTQLHDFLDSGKWHEADRATTRIMLQGVGRQQQGWFRRQDINKLSCEDLRIINQLWLESTEGNSGFSRQKEIWQMNGSPVHARGKASISDGKIGKFPSDLWEGKWGMWDVTMVEFFSRVANCSL